MMSLRILRGGVCGRCEHDTMELEYLCAVMMNLCMANHSKRSVNLLTVVSLWMSLVSSRLPT